MVIQISLILSSTITNLLLRLSEVKNTINHIKGIAVLLEVFSIPIVVILFYDIIVREHFSQSFLGGFLSIRDFLIIGKVGN